MPRVADEKLLSDLVRELHNRYDIWCRSIHPIPGSKHPYNIEDIYVDNGIKPSGDSNKKRTSLSSYQYMFSTKCKRLIIEADAGYGKTSMMLKAASDWRNKENDSPLRDIDIFVLLQMKSLRGMTFYEAIIKSLLPVDTTFTPVEIKRVLTMPDIDVVIGLDGYDEYPDREEDTDFRNIIYGEMLQDAKVILLTRTDCLPEDSDSIEKYSLLEFSNEAHQRYISKAFDDSQSESVNALLLKFSTNSIINNLLKVPLFFTMFVHLEEELKDVEPMESVTGLFEKFMCVFENRLIEKQRKIKGQTNKKTLSEEQIARLGKVALKGLKYKGEGIAWSKDRLMHCLGEEGFNNFTDIGILVEEEDASKAEIRNISLEENKKTVKFIHKVICEWYAAKYLVRVLEKTILQQNQERQLKKLNPFELQYLYRFTCGMSLVAAEKIIHYLRRGRYGEEFALLCEVEKTGEVTETIATEIEKMCEENVSFFEPSSRLLRHSRVQLLEIASRQKIPIQGLFLESCYSVVDGFPDSLGMKSGLVIPPLSTLKELHIYSVSRRMTDEEIENILTYASKCNDLKLLRFLKTLQPMQISLEALHAIKAKQVKCVVSWLPEKDKLTYLLDQETGRWKVYPEEIPIGSELLILDLSEEDFDGLEYLDESYYKKTLECNTAETEATESTGTKC